MLLCNFIEITLRHGCSTINLLHIFRTPFPKNNSEGLLLLLQYRAIAHRISPTHLNHSLTVRCLEETLTILFYMNMN